MLREWKVDPIETGTFYHAALNGFARLVRREAAYPNLPDEAVSCLGGRGRGASCGGGARGPMGDGDRSLARFEAARGAIRRAAVAITRQLAAGRFSLFRTEAAFGYEGGHAPPSCCF